MTILAAPAKAERYIWPPRPQDAIPRTETEFLKDSDWEAQLKYNDTHIEIKYLPNGQIELWNRHAERIRSYHCPDWFMEQIQAVPSILGLQWPGHYHLLDGGLLDNKHVAIKDTIVIWDILVREGVQLIGSTYGQRYDELFRHAPTTPWVYAHPSHAPIRFGTAITPNIFFPQMIVWEDWDRIWDDIIAVVNKPFTKHEPNHPDYECHPVIEGLVFKKMNGKLEFGFKEKNNGSWMMRSRVQTGRHRF